MALSKPTLFVYACLLLILPDVTDIVTAVDGKWSEWWEWQPCSASCGTGLSQRFRLCNNPPRSGGGADCVGKAVDSRECKAGIACIVHGGWNDWTEWTECSVTCGEGVSIRRRECNSPAPANGGRVCEGASEELLKCVSAEECPRDGKWSRWGKWSECSVTCGQHGSRSRFRSCNNPPPNADGKMCPGPDSGTKKCISLLPCPVNGHWSRWSRWAPCSVTCGVGVTIRWRKCDNPPPQNGGLDCNRTEAAETQEKSCNVSSAFCPVDGGWSDWGEWGKCNSENCGSPGASLFVVRERSCNNPYPAHDGTMCPGAFLNATRCEEPTNCPVDGEWSEWSVLKCTRLAATLTRSCDNPAPANGGRQCSGEATEILLNDDEQYRDHCPDMPEGSGEDENGSLEEEKEKAKEDEVDEDYEEGDNEEQ